MLTESELQDLLLAVLSGATDTAKETIAQAELSEVERARLAAALDAASPSEAARALGDELHLLHADRDLVNECYRAAFYSGPDSLELADNPLFAYFLSRKSGRPLDKWVHYFPVYHQTLDRFRGQPIKVLEIGTFHGGGLDLLSHYLGPQAHVYGMDIAMGSERVGEPHTVIVGDQSDPDWLTRMSEAYGPFDVVIDDGGHTMKQQIVTAETLFPLLNDGAVLIVEDCHTSYWAGFQDADRTFLDWVRERVDDINAVHDGDRAFSVWSDHLDSIAIYDSLVILHKKRRFRPFSEVVGSNEFILRDRDQASALISLRTIRDETNRLLAEDLAEAQESVGRLQNELEQIQGSRSWRMTAGLRRLRKH